MVQGPPIARVLAPHWWALILRGLAAIALGLLTFLWPGLTFEILVLFWGAYALIDGIFAVVAALAGRGTVGRWWALLLEGLLGIAAGIITFLRPGLTAVVLIYLIATWAVITGVLEVIAGARLREHTRGAGAFTLGGVLSVLLGIALFVMPGAGVLALMWLIGTYAILFGLFLVGLGLSLRQARRAPLV